MIRSVVLLPVLASHFMSAQVPVPIVTSEDRFFIFHDGRFKDMEPRPPAFALAMEGQVVYKDHQGELKLFVADGTAPQLLDRRTDVVVRGSRHRIAWLAGDTLKTLRDGHAVRIAGHVEDFVVSDSLIVMLDSVLHELNVLWKGKSTKLATVPLGSERPQWAQGGNTVAFFNKEVRTLIAFYHGEVRTLCDRTDTGIVVAGGDIIGYWNDVDRTYHVLYRGADVKLSDLRPASAKAGAGLLAFVDGDARLKCFERGELRTVLDRLPDDYWVEDSLLLFMHRGQLKLFRNGATTTVEPYIPERWQVEGGMLAYLDINRELRGILGGERFRFGNEANIASFDLLGDAVVYRSRRGTAVVATRRSTYEF